MKKGLICTVYKAAGEDGCTNGPTRQAKRVLLTGKGVAEIFSANGMPVFVLDRGPGGQVIAVSADANPKGRPMFSGNFIGTSDSRFSEAARTLDPGWDHWVVPVFDRDESQSFGSTHYRVFSFSENSGAVRTVVAEIEIGLEDAAVADFFAFSVMGANLRQEDGAVQSWSRADGTAFFLANASQVQFHEYETMLRVKIESVKITTNQYQQWVESRGDDDQFLIYSSADDSFCGYNSGFWNNERAAWVSDIKEATRYSLNDRLLIRPHCMPKPSVSGSNVPRSVFVAISSIRR